MLSIEQINPSARITPGFNNITMTNIIIKIFGIIAVIALVFCSYLSMVWGAGLPAILVLIFLTIVSTLAVVTIWRT